MNIIFLLQFLRSFKLYITAQPYLHIFFNAFSHTSCRALSFRHGVFSIRNQSGTNWTISETLPLVSVETEWIVAGSSVSDLCTLTHELILISSQTVLLAVVFKMNILFLLTLPQEMTAWSPTGAWNKNSQIICNSR